MSKKICCRRIINSKRQSPPTDWPNDTVFLGVCVWGGHQLINPFFTATATTTTTTAFNSILVQLFTRLPYQGCQFVCECAKVLPVRRWKSEKQKWAERGKRKRAQVINESAHYGRHPRCRRRDENEEEARKRQTSMEGDMCLSGVRLSRLRLRLRLLYRARKIQLTSNTAPSFSFSLSLSSHQQAPAFSGAIFNVCTAHDHHQAPLRRYDCHSLTKRCFCLFSSYFPTFVA